MVFFNLFYFAVFFGCCFFCLFSSLRNGLLVGPGVACPSPSWAVCGTVTVVALPSCASDRVVDVWAPLGASLGVCAVSCGVGWVSSEKIRGI